MSDQEFHENRANDEDCGKGPTPRQYAYSKQAQHDVERCHEQRGQEGRCQNPPVEKNQTFICLFGVSTRSSPESVTKHRENLRKRLKKSRDKNNRSPAA
jgi:hypothetical protein